ncbi:cytochrome b [Mycobacterium angelicum]|uniref:Cytochrome B n=1 Tax=Mycobacterium angelicum TaxID=470074 RepID=A0A1W9ZPN8_MYCAN|nr:cytochrome b/b6 domain-containing protein [Mycobacterium angelicum]MCV7199125.1 cytochrome b [Mycobacterium angelicum]ORA19585.1 cytochrome B [Mycobacterium angelicum]
MTQRATAVTSRFALPSRILHWLMAPMVVAQLFIGVTTVASLSYYPLLLAIHRPLGILILVFALARLVNRLIHRLPPFPATMGPAERRIASWSEYLLYALLLVQPLIGWAMLSAARFPITVAGPLRLPRIAPYNLDVYAALRFCHSVFGYLLFLTFTAHLCAVLFHTLVLRDRLLDRMAIWPTKPTPAKSDEQ